MQKIYLSILAIFLLITNASAQTCTGDFTFTLQSEVDQFIIDNPTCTHIDGNVTLHYYDVANPIPDLSGLQNVVSISGDLSISVPNNSTSSPLADLSSLTTVGGTLYIGGTNDPTYFTNLDGLENLTSVQNLMLNSGYIMDIHGLDGLVNVENIEWYFGEQNFSATFDNVFPNVINVPGSIVLKGNLSGEISGFSSVLSVGNLTIGGLMQNTSFDSLDIFHSLVNIETIFYIEHLQCNFLTGFQNLESVSEIYFDGITGYFGYSVFPDFESLTDLDNLTFYYSKFQTTPAFNSLTHVTSNIFIYSSFEAVDFNSLIEVGGDITIGAEGMPNIFSVSTPSLLHVGGDLWLFNTGVEDLSFLSNIQAVDGLLNIDSNWSLTNCEAQIICDKIATDPANIIVTGNTVCEYIEDAAQHCSLNAVSGMVYIDYDCDGVYNNNDTPYTSPIITNDLNLPVGTTGGSGFYFIPIDNNVTMTFEPAAAPGFIPTTPLSVTTDNVNQDYPNFDYAMCPDPNGHDVAVLSPIVNSPRPGFTRILILKIKNQSINLESGSLVFDFSNMPGVSVSNAYSGNVVGNTVVYDIPSLTAFETETFFLALLTDAATPLGTIQSPLITITVDSSTDQDLSNNVYTWNETVIGSYDPNDIAVNIEAQNFDLLPTNGLTLDYTIRFQNTGTAPAEFVRVRDIIEEDLNLGSIQMLSSSHNYQLTFNDDREVEWLFENIQLPDSTTDLEGSQGYIHYRIKTNPDVTIDDLIENTAAIYFDYNAPVITNTATTLFYTCPAQISTIGTTEICEGETSSMMASGGYDNYNWNINNQSVSTEQSFGLEDLITGIYILEYEGTTEYCTSSNEVEITINAIPEVPTITQNVNTLTASGTGTFVWTFNGEVLPETDNSIEMDESGGYSVSVTTNDCISDVTTGNFIHTGIESIESEFDFTIYPNPVNDKLIINTNTSSKVEINIYDSFGKTVMNKAIGGSNTGIDCSSLSDGIYFLKLNTTNTESSMKMFVVSHQ